MIFNDPTKDEFFFQGNLENKKKIHGQLLLTTSQAFRALRKGAESYLPMW